MLVALIAALTVGVPADEFLCNPQSKAVAKVPALATVRVGADAQPAAGLFLVRSKGEGLYEIAVPAPHRAYVVDLNRNGRPDFAGDRWVFDARGDGLAETIVENMQDAPHGVYDLDGDGLRDAYLIDADNNGLFDTRVWYNHARGEIVWAEGNRFRRAQRRLEFPGQSFALANYRRLRDFYRTMLREHQPLVEPDGRVNLADATDTRPSATVGLDLYHAGAVWHDTGRQGFSRLLTSISRRPVAVETLGTPFSPQSLARLTHLVVVDVLREKTLSEEELASLDHWLRAGGRMLLVLPDAAAGPSSALVARRYGVAVGPVEPLNLKPAPLERFCDAQQRPLPYAIDNDGFCLDAAWSLLPAVEGASLLDYRFKDEHKKERQIVLAAESPVAKGRVVICGSRSLMDNRYTAYKLPKTRPFDRRRFSNRAFLEETVRRLFE